MNIVVALDDQIPHNFAQSRWVFLINTNVDNLVKQLLGHALNLLIFLNVLNDLFEMLLLWPHSQSLKKIVVDQRMNFHLFVRKDIPSKKILRLFPCFLCRNRREKYLVDHQLNVGNDLVELVRLVDHRQQKELNVFRVIHCNNEFFQGLLGFLFGRLSELFKEVDIILTSSLFDKHLILVKSLKGFWLDFVLICVKFGSVRSLEPYFKIIEVVINLGDSGFWLTDNRALHEIEHVLFPLIILTRGEHPSHWSNWLLSGCGIRDKLVLTLNHL